MIYQWIISCTLSLKVSINVTTYLINILTLNRCVEVLQLKGNKCKHRILYNFAAKYKFLKLSYTYFHPQKHILLNNFNFFFCAESCYKIDYVAKVIFDPIQRHK